MKIREPVERDIDHIARLLLETHDAHVSAFPDLYREFSFDEARGIVASRLVEKNSFYRIAEINGEIAGYTYFQLKTAAATPFTLERTFAYVCEIAVEDANRRSGVGGFLMDSVIKCCKELGVARLELDVWSFNDAALSFFESRDFRVVGRKMGRAI